MDATGSGPAFGMLVIPEQHSLCVGRHLASAGLQVSTECEGLPCIQMVSTPEEIVRITPTFSASVHCKTICC